MLIRALDFLLNTFLGTFAGALVLRFLLQLLRAPARHPLAPFLSALTDWVVRPARRVIPGLWGLDLATLVAAWATEALLLAVSLWLWGADPGPAVGAAAVAVLLAALVALLRLAVYLVMGATILQAVLSWTGGDYHPMTPVLSALTRPFLEPLRRRIPPIGNVDISPAFLVIACQLLVMLLAGLQANLGAGG